MAILPDRAGIKFSLGPIRVLSGMAVSRPEWANDGLVIENFVAAFVGLGLLIYLGYALARPDRF